MERLKAEGKFLYLGEEKLYLKAFPGESAELASAAGGNTVWLTDPIPERLHRLEELGLYAVADLGLAQALERLFAGGTGAFEAWRAGAKRQIAAMGEQPHLLAYDLGGPIHHSVQRMLGRPRLRQLLRSAADLVKHADPTRPVTFRVTPADLRDPLPFLDFFTVDLFEDDLADFRIQLSRVQAAASGKPLVVGAAGTQFPGSGTHEWAYRIDQQIRMAFVTAGCAGLVVRAWRGDELQEGQRRRLAEESRAALPRIKTAFAETPFPPYLRYPKFSVVICVYNGEDTIEECLEGVSRLDYPDFEVIVVNDGSTDGTLRLAAGKAARLGYRVVSQTPNGGLSAARNLGMRLATGEFIAYLDADAFPERHWLRYLAATFLNYKYAAVGGPNLNPLGATWVSGCVDQAPGNPQIVFRKAEAADHLPGCNLAVRASFMRAMGGFDPHYRGGGDDVHFCWQVLKYGERLGVSPGAMVWHHRRGTVTGFLRQQRGYGKGEAVLEKDWPERFNSLGHQSGLRESTDPREAVPPWARSRVYQEVPGFAGALERWAVFYPSMPEWALGVLALAVASGLGILSPPFFVFAPFFAVGLLFLLARAVIGATRAELRSPSFAARALVGALFLLQPLSRLRGRLEGGLTPWRIRCVADGFAFPRTRVLSHGNADRLALAELRDALGASLMGRKLPAVEGGEGVPWDWQVEGGLFGGARCLMNIENEQMRLRVFPYASRGLRLAVTASLLGGVLAAVLGAVPLALFLAVLALGAGERGLRQAGNALASLQSVARGKFWESSLWDEFQPPSHFFEKGPLPKDRATRR